MVSSLKWGICTASYICSWCCSDYCYSAVIQKEFLSYWLVCVFPYTSFLACYCYSLVIQREFLSYWLVCVSLCSVQL